MKTVDGTLPLELLIPVDPPEARAGLTPTNRRVAMDIDPSSSDRATVLARRKLVDHLGPGTELAPVTFAMRVDGPRALAREIPGFIARSGDGRSVATAAYADPVCVVITGEGSDLLDWSLLPGGPSVTERADGLRLLRSLARGGVVTLRTDAIPSPIQLRLDRTEFELEDEWRLFEDLATISEWSGVDLPVPDHVSSADATRAAQAAGWIRSETRDARISGPVTFEVPPGVDASAANELRVRDELDIELLGRRIDLGTTSVRLPLAHVERTSDTGARGRLASPDVTVHLHAPAGRRGPAVRTQGAVSAPTNGASRSRAYARKARIPVTDMLSRSLAQRRPSSVPSGVLINELRGH